MPEEEKSGVEDNTEDLIPGKAEVVYKIKKNPWQISSAVLGVAVLILLVVVFRGGAGITGNVISGEDAGSKLVDYLNLRTGGGVEYVFHEDLGNLYEVTVLYKGDQIPVFVTKDGEYFVTSVQPMADTVNTPSQAQSQSPEVPKSDRPKAEAFVFSYCPYGLQFQKALLPVYEMLKDKADIELVAIGAMHGEYEKKESLRQICIEKEYGKDKLWDYLERFMGDTGIGECGSNMECSEPLVERVLTQAGIDKNRINTCIQKDAETIYRSQNTRAQELGIGGSPNFVINDVQVQVGRNAEAIKDALCNAFNEIPEECDEGLSTEGASPGFGYSASSGSSGGQC